MVDVVASVETFTLTQERDQPYLGNTRADEQPNKKGYFVRQANRTVYPTFDRSVVVRIKTGDGVVGWGETYGIVAPGAVAAIINDLLADFTIGRDPADPSAIYDDLYDLMRVRGYTGGFYVDALAALDIALWDISARQSDKSVSELVGQRWNTEIPAYVSGLPKPTLIERCEFASEWLERGFDAFKFATPMAHEDPATELAHLRSVLGPTVKIAADMHWNQTSEKAIELINCMEPHELWFAEAPVRTEDIAGLESVSKSVDAPIAVGEEWRTHHDLLHRVDRCRLSIVQPEMGHTGITNFMRMGKLAADRGLSVIPHATIGAGIFLAASLQVSSTLKTLTCHEFQHSIFVPNRHLLDSDMDCVNGAYVLPSGPGLGVTPSEQALRLLQPI